MTKVTGWKIGFAALLVFAATSAQAQTFTTVADFDGANGHDPISALVQGVDGNFYGTAYAGGKGCAPDGCGTAFRVTSDGGLAALDLTSISAYPVAGLILAANQKFYGTSSSGGTGWGSVFAVTQRGTLTTLYSFCPQYPCADGSRPDYALVQGVNGSFYGTTFTGGDFSACPAGAEGCGTVFAVNAAGKLTTLHRFCVQTGCPDGNSPHALMQGLDGNFYGTAFYGGATDTQCGVGCGTVFKITPSGKFVVLHTFNYDDGLGPEGLVQANDGTFYGITYEGGANGAGTVFTMTPDGALTTLYNFCSGGGLCLDGTGPIGSLIQGTDGMLYGVTFEGGAAGDGTIFQIGTDGVLTTLHTFEGTDGDIPQDGLVQSTAGRFFGTSSAGGNLSCSAPYGCGTIYSLDMGLGPFVTFVNAFGKVGRTGGILGQGFTGSTIVSFNGIPANFTVVSDTYIKATVPPGATTGYVTVTTPTGVLTSNVPFQVIR